MMKKPDTDDVIAHIEADDHQGWCFNCGDWTHDSCEPDATAYKCPECGKHQCYGAEEILVMGAHE